ncbi:unnamed protein product [Ectocarpus sp. CCAP 1310/34]|nr:unnamed protein product [Ectocarpus sp. CCAP 1310/34]
MIPSHQDTIAVDVPVAERSGRAVSVHELDVPEVLNLGDGCRSRASTKGVGEKNEDDPTEVVALRELVQRQREDLETAALIGQRLLDRVEELSASLEASEPSAHQLAVREEKWLAECEKDALRRDLDSATQRCEQMQQDTTTEALPRTSSTKGHLFLSAAEEPQVEYLDLWSPAAHARTGARSSLSDDRPLSPVLENSPDAAEDAARHEQDREEIGRLRRAVEGLEEANTSLREELTESRLEATALRRTSTTQKEAALDRVMNEAIGDDGEEHRQVRAGWGAPNDGQEEDEAEGDRQPRSFFSSSSSGVQEEGAPFDETEACHAGEQDGLQPEETGDGGPPGCRARRESGGGGGEGTHRRKQSIESIASSRSFRCRSSSMFRDAQEQAELIEALRAQIAQLRLEAKATTRAAGTEFRWSDKAAASYEHDGGAGHRRGVCSSDDDSGSDRGRDTSRDEDAVGEEGGNGREKIGSMDEDGRRVDEHRSNPLLRARVDELQAELETTKRALEVLQRRAQQEQAVSVELQRELLRLHGTRYNSGAVAAAVARVSAGTLRPASYTAGRASEGGSDGGSSNRRGSDNNGGRGTGLERRIDYTMFEGMGRLHPLWRILFCGGCGETAGSGVDTSFEDSGAVNDDGVGDVRTLSPGSSESDEETFAVQRGEEGGLT